MKVGLIGAKLGHSFSKVIHERLCDYRYDLIPLDEEEFHAFMQFKPFDAINVTIPYKEKVIPYLDEIDKKAKKINAVNAIKNIDGRLIGTNTDYDGLKYMIEKHFNLENEVVAICGSGGTSKTALAVLESLNVKEIVRVARNKERPYITYEEMKKRQDITYIINTTSVGMYPNMMSRIVDVNDFMNLKGVIDVVYNPLCTSLCFDAKQKGLPYITGLEMLVGQAIVAIEFFLDKKIDKNLIDEITKSIIKEKQNFVIFSDDPHKIEDKVKEMATKYQMCYHLVDEENVDIMSQKNHAVLNASHFIDKKKLLLNGIEITLDK